MLPPIPNMTVQNLELIQKASNYVFAGKKERGLSICKKILAKDPADFNANHLVGVIHLKSGRPEYALNFFKKALKVGQGEASLLVNVASAYWSLNDLRRAKNYASLSISVDPALIAGYEMLGQLASLVYDIESAEKAYIKAISLSPEKIELYICLAEIYRRACRFKEAESVLESIPKKDANNELLNLEWLQLYEEQGRVSDAIELGRWAKKEAVSYRDSYDGILLRMLRLHGEKELAVSHAEEILQENENSLHAIFTLLKLKAYPGGVAEAEKKFLKFSADALEPENYVALASAYDNDGNYEKAMSLYAKGNKLYRKKYTKFSVDKGVLGGYEKIKKTCQNLDYESVTWSQVQGAPIPIFILGMPRSGTSLTEQILGCHSQVHPAGELRFLPTMLGYGQGDLYEISKQCQDYPEHLEWVRKTYLSQIKHIAKGANYLIDKLPGNTDVVGLIRYIFPEAKIIYSVRDPLDNCLSVYKTPFTGDHPYSHNFRELAHYYYELRSFMEYWREMFPGSIYELKYEKLVHNMQSEIKQVLLYLGLGWEEPLDTFYDSKRVVKTASNEQVRNPIYQSSLGSWRKYEPYIQDLVQELEARQHS